ncbi:MAG: aminoacyl-tRNA deacylase [Kordiimonadales bacterium]|nr:MAG: aminoacyl-tRNA deacylase [Kordiimonadales bacterium]
MSIAPTIRDYLKESGIKYDLVPHKTAYSANRIAEVAHISGASIAKGVLLNTERGYMMAVVPASCKVDLADLSHQMKSRLGLASEHEIDMIFDDCDPGVAPACASAYAMRVVVDTRLDALEDLYMESGDHENLIHVTKSNFAKIMAEAKHAGIAHPV